MKKYHIAHFENISELCIVHWWLKSLIFVLLRGTSKKIQPLERNVVPYFSVKVKTAAEKKSFYRDRIMKLSVNYRRFLFTEAQPEVYPLGSVCFGPVCLGLALNGLFWRGVVKGY